MHFDQRLPSLIPTIVVAIAAVICLGCAGITCTGIGLWYMLGEAPTAKLEQAKVPAKAGQKFVNGKRMRLSGKVEFIEGMPRHLALTVDRNRVLASFPDLVSGDHVTVEGEWRDQIDEFGGDYGLVHVRLIKEGK